MTAVPLPDATRRLRRLPRLDVVRPLWMRIAVAVVAVGLLVTALRLSSYDLLVWLALVAPDLPGLAGAGRDLAPKQMHPRAVRAYNAAHRLTGGLLLGAVAAAIGSTDTAAVALAWLAHVGVDRASGYTLRTPTGELRR